MTTVIEDRREEFRQNNWYEVIIPRPDRRIVTRLDYENYPSTLEFWCVQNLNEPWKYVYTTIDLAYYFLTAADAIAFKIRWM